MKPVRLVLVAAAIVLIGASLGGVRLLGLRGGVFTATAAALVLGAAGYALQGRPGQPGSPAQASDSARTVPLAEARHAFFERFTGAVARTSTFALNNATLPFALKLANLGAEAAMAEDPHLAEGLNVSDGKIRNLPVAEALGLPYFPLAA